MSDPGMVIPPPTPAPIEPESSGGLRFLRTFASILITLALIVLFLYPDAIRFVIHDWKGSTEPLRVFAFVGFFVYSTITGIATVISVSKKRAEVFGQFAAAVGGSLSDNGRQIDYRIDGLQASLTIDRNQKTRGTNRLAIPLGTTARDFQIQVLAGGAAARFLMSKKVLSPVFSLALSAGPGPRSERAAGVAQLQYMMGDPLATGESFDKEFVVKSSDETLGRGLVTDPGFRQALQNLRTMDRGTHFAMERQSSSSPLRILVEAPQAVASVSLFQAMDQVARAATSSLGRLGVLTEAA
jgi:hypothetical protein